MYSNNHSATGPGPLELSNNPFIDDPSNPHTRFPDISGSSPISSTLSIQNGYQQPQYQQQYQTGINSNQPQPNQLQNQYLNSGQYPQQSASTSYNPQFYGGPSVSPAPQPTGRPFQPSSSFGQHLVSHVDSQFLQPQQQQYTGMQLGYSNAPQQQQYDAYQQAGYQGYQQPQPQQNTGYVQEFDPYAPMAQGWNGAQNQTPSQGQQPMGSNSGASNQLHPRDYIRTHKVELESWDSYAWRQMINACDALKSAWEARKREIDARLTAMGGGGAPGFFGPVSGGYQGGYGGYGMNPEVERLKVLLKEADSHCDTIAASSFQLQEVHTSYRQSGDPASKRRVRESCNAALTGLPDWPVPW